MIGSKKLSVVSIGQACGSPHESSDDFPPHLGVG